MKRKSIKGFFPVVIVMIVAFFSILLLADVNPSVAATSKKKSTEVTRPTAVERTEARIKQLQGALKITEPQQALWNTLTQVMRDNAKEFDELATLRVESTKIVNAVDNMKFYYQISKTHLDQQAKFIPPFEELYTSMSDAQKQTADLIFRTGKLGRHRIK